MESHSFKTSSFQNTASSHNVPKKLFEECIPICFPTGAQVYTDSMLNCAVNCKSKTIETYNAFKKIYKEKLENDGFVLNANSYKNEDNPFEGMESNPRMQSAMKNFKVHTAPLTVAKYL